MSKAGLLVCPACGAFQTLDGQRMATTCWHCGKLVHEKKQAGGPGMKTITLYDFLYQEQIEQALAIWKKNEFPAKEICEKIIKPNIAEINRKLGQENDPLYLAYACEYVLNQSQRREP